MALDLRVVRLGIEIDGQLKTYEGLRIAASGSKFANPLQNEATIAVDNLSAYDRNYLITETSPFNKNRTRKRVMLWVGRQRAGVHLIFSGDITGCTQSQPSDITLTIKAKTTQFYKGEITAMTASAVTPLSELSQRVAQALDVTLLFEATDKNIGSFSFSGAKAKLVDALQQAGGVDAYIDDDQLVVKDSDKPRQNITHELSAESGMVGAPEITDDGIKVKYLINSESQIGGRLTLKSITNPAANGEYTVYKLKFEVATHAEAFYYIVEAKRSGESNT